MAILYIILGLFFIISPVIAIIAFVQAGHLRRDLNQLRADFNQYKNNALKAPEDEKRRAVQAATLPTESRELQSASQAAPQLNPKAQSAPPKTLPKAPKAAMRPSVKTAPRPSVKTTAQIEKMKRARKPQTSLEEKIGSQWSVWVGGLALAIGAVFLIRFSIESGIFSPALRLVLAAVLGLTALGGGEWLRRRDDLLAAKDDPKARHAFNQAYIPGVLTAVGVFTWLGVIYAAHSIYGFIGPAAAFGLLGLISLMGLALGLLHGPKMAALGLLAALATPLLVDSAAASFPALYTYLLLVGGAALTLASKRRWSELSVLTLFGLLLWTFLSQGAFQTQAASIMWIIFAGMSYGASLWIVVRQERVMTPKANALKTDALKTDTLKTDIWSCFDIAKFDRRLSAVWTAALALISMVNYGLASAPNLALTASLSLAVLFIAVGAWQRRFNWHIIIGAALASVFAVWGELNLNMALIIAGLTAVLIWGLGLRESRQSRSHIAPQFPPHYWAIISALAPIILWTTITMERGWMSFVKTPWFDLNALGYVEAIGFTIITLVLGGTAEYLWRRGDAQNSKAFAVNIYVAGAGIAAALGLLMCLNIDVIFYAALTAAVGGGALYYYRPVWALRPLIAGALALAALFAGLHHIQGGDVGTRLIANGLWIFLALPAALSFALAKLLSRKEEDFWSEGLKAFALSLGILFIIMQIHHSMNNGRVLASSFSLEEAALFVLTGLSFTLGRAWMERGEEQPIRKRALHKQILPMLSMGLSLAALAGFILSVVLAMNPLFNADIEIKGGLILNSLLLAFLLPAILLGALAVLSRNSRPKAYVRGLGGLGFVSFMIYMTASVRRIFSGRSISLFDRAPEGAELYAISAVWLIMGISLLVIGLKTRRQDVRILSGVIIILTVLKAFLIDMAGLEGVLRAMSFVVLGVILIIIGRVYQRLVFKDQKSGLSSGTEMA